MRSGKERNLVKSIAICYAVFTIGNVYAPFLVAESSLYRDLVEPTVDSPAKAIGSDFNGDGIADIIGGAHLNNDGGGADSGAVYVLYGTNAFSNTYRLDGAGVNVTIVGKAANDQLGLSLDSIGDINSDGFDDMMMGARLNNDGGADDEGAVYILYGHPSLSANYALNGAGVDITIIGKSANDYLGFRISGGGDINGDGFDDALLGAFGQGDLTTQAGAVYILYGSASLSADYDIAGAGVSVSVLGKAGSDRLGASVGSAGDVNRDGFDDVIMGAHLNDDGGGDAGAAYVLFGGTSLSATIRLDGAGGNVTILGDAADDLLGLNSTGTGDVNGDGFDDMIVSAHQSDTVTTDGGATYIIYGRGFSSGTTLDVSASNQDVTIFGTNDTDNFGYGVSNAGDINDDGFQDIIGGARLNDSAASSAGSAYIIYGSSSLASSINAGHGDITILGKATNNSLGRDVSGAGDFNNDGFPDLIVGAYVNDDLATDNGAAYILFGGESLSSSFRLDGGGVSLTILGKALSDDFGIALGGGRGHVGP